jgi:amino acid transporter
MPNIRDSSAHHEEVDSQLSDAPSIRIEQYDSLPPDTSSSTSDESKTHRYSGGTELANQPITGASSITTMPEPNPGPDKIDKASSIRTNSDPTSSKSRKTTTTPRSDIDNWSETGTEVHVPRRNLTELDVAALILNKMIGTGIFTTPGTVLAYTKSREVSIALWTVGGVWTSLFLLVYLEFGIAFPFNGGELIYLDEIYYWPELLATILFSGFFLVLGNSYGNSVAFAKNVLLSADLDKARTTELDSRLIRFVAIAVVTLVCLIHYFSARAGLFLNKVLFWYKSLLLLVVFAAGMNFVKKNGSEWNNYNELKERGSSIDSMAAMISIFYTYQGWENANYVTGEIRALAGRTPARTLKIGAFSAVGVVWLLYVLVTLAYYMVLDYDSITDKHSDLGMAIHFAPKVFGSSLGMRVCLAISAFGNILAVTYTSAKVKQAIALQRIIPFYKFFQRDLETPKGALALHWVSSIILIAICPTTSDGYSFATGLFTYGHIVVSGFVVMGLFTLERRMHEADTRYRLTFFRWKWMLWPLSFIFAASNLPVLIFSAKPNKPGNIPRYWWPGTFFLIILGSLIYWALMMLMTVETKRGGNGEKKQTIGRKVGFEVRVFKADDEMPQDASQALEESIVQSRQDGSKRRVEYEFSGVFLLIGKSFKRFQTFLAKFIC